MIYCSLKSLTKIEDEKKKEKPKSIANIFSLKRTIHPDVQRVIGLSFKRRNVAWT